MINNILITGASGEIGQNLVSKLSENKNLKLVGLDIISPPQDLKDKFFRFYKVNLLEFTKINKIIRSNDIRTVFHLGAILSTEAEKKPFLAHRINVDSSVNLLSLSSNYANEKDFKVKFIFPSSIAVYNLPSKNAKNKNIKVKEDQFLDPVTMYGINKLYCEEMGVYFSKHTYGNNIISNLDFRSVRFPGLLSATTLPSGGTSDYAPEMIHYSAKGKKYECFVRPDTVIPFMTMHDAIRVLTMITSAQEKKLKSRIYNVSGFSVSAREVEKETKRYFPNSKITYSPNKDRQKIVDSWPRDIDDKRSRKDWGWKPEHNFKKAFKEYLIPAVKKRYKIS